MPPNTVVVTRLGLFGNPFPVAVYGRAQAVELHRRWLLGLMSTQEMSMLSRCDRRTALVSLAVARHWVLGDLPALRGKNLACWCKLDDVCHADTLLKLANTVHTPASLARERQ
jgi:hypothetical protein